MRYSTATKICAFAGLAVGVMGATSGVSADRFVVAAESWAGADIKEMVSRWGRPTSVVEGDHRLGLGTVVHWANFPLERTPEPRPPTNVSTHTRCTGYRAGTTTQVDCDTTSGGEDAAYGTGYALESLVGSLFRRRGHVSAEFDEAGRITRVDVVENKRCASQFKDKLETMTRPSLQRPPDITASAAAEPAAGPAEEEAVALPVDEPAAGDSSQQ